ncbi:hypothetical protein ULMS_10510 [Patiriisocius marinistellae]|uniref:Lipoprotein n=1 Tax=Patiriisocius marinistellae TaxID=2494560 RepID=A0A5J4FUN4_9FLAO|nr:hypothetical protein [Patiriisocius marinistellae]GEQ85543.1 hypothetical protein ULMS_10510 [Patiriisocius marinistellae]
MRNLFLIAIVAVLTFTSCNVTESITFNEDMGGTYKSSFDLTTMMQMAKQMGPSTSKKEKVKMDTLISVNELMVVYKDSIAKLSPEKQEQLKAMKDMNMHMVMDEEEGVFLMEMNKPFKTFDDIAFVSYQMDEMFNIAKSQSGQNESGAANSGANDMLGQEKVTYTFVDNTFRRVDPKKLVEEGETFDMDIEEEEQTDEEKAASDMMDGMLGQFEDMLKESTMILEYTFPKKIKSVSHEGAVISEDGKTVTFTVDWKKLTDDKELLRNFEVKLEE